MNAAEIQDWFLNLDRFVIGTMTFDRTKAFAEFQNLARSIIKQQFLECAEVYLDDVYLDIERDGSQHPINEIGLSFCHFQKLCQWLSSMLGNAPDRVITTIRRIFDEFLEIVADDINCPICGNSMYIHPDDFDENRLAYACDDCGYEPDSCSPNRGRGQRLDNKGIERLGLVPVRTVTRWEQADERKWKLLSEQSPLPLWFKHLGENS